MNSIFGDATSVMPSPATIAEAESLFSGQRSPVTSLDMRRQSLSADNAIPGLDIDPPPVQVKNGRPILSSQSSDHREGFGGWISSMVRRTREEGESRSGSYKQVRQEEDQ